MPGLPRQPSPDLSKVFSSRPHFPLTISEVASNRRDPPEGCASIHLLSTRLARVPPAAGKRT